MDPITQQTVIAAAGAGGGDPVYVDDVFSTYLYTGTGSAQTITNGIDISGEGGLVWIKNRESAGQDHALYDTERGAGQTLASNTTSAQFNSTNRLSALNSNGFTVGTDTATNQSGTGIASWTFRKAPGFFDVVTYTGTGGNGQTVSHSLGSVPGMIIVKQTDASGEPWMVQHRYNTNKKLKLNTTDAESSGQDGFDNTAPTSSGFFVRYNSTNKENSTYVAYIFAHDDAQFGTGGDESIIKCGSYTGNGSKKIVELGFEPQWVIIKRTNAVSSWYMADMMRGMLIETDGKTFVGADTAAAEGNGKMGVHATGLTINESHGGLNNTNDTYIYMAIRRPHKPPTAATEVFAIDTGNGSSTIPVFDSGFPVDFALLRDTSATENWQSFTRLTDKYHFIPNNSNALSNAGTLFTFDSNVGWAKNQYTSAYYSWMFKRAPGFFDVVNYTGISHTSQNISHNLTVAPELMIVKCDKSAEFWAVYAASEGYTKYLRLNENNASSTNTTYWEAAPTATTFRVKSGNEINNGGEQHYALLFATLPGISKVGSYAGTGNLINIDCGFTNGARFVLIKRTDAQGGWLVYDTTRGITSGDDPYIRLDSSQAQTTDEDHIDPLNAGFTVTTHGDVNTSGGNYIFLAIA